MKADDRHAELTAHACTELWQDPSSPRLSASQPPPHISPSSPATTSSDPYNTGSRPQFLPRTLPPTHRVEVQEDMGPVGLKVTHVTVREGSQLQGRGDGHRSLRVPGVLPRWSRAPKDGGRLWVADGTFSRSALRAWNPLRRVMSAIAMPDSPTLPLRLQGGGASCTA